MKQIIVGKGTIVHIGGIPFALTKDAEMESHPRNVAAVFGEGGGPVFNFRPSIFDKIRRWWHSW